VSFEFLKTNSLWKFLFLCFFGSVKRSRHFVFTALSIWNSIDYCSIFHYFCLICFLYLHVILIVFKCLIRLCFCIFWIE
jgi:hypothetical protein